MQYETSHSQRFGSHGIYALVQNIDVFRVNLLREMQSKGLKAAQLSRLAGLNPRAVKDLEEGRAASPKLSTVFKLAEALEVDPGELMGLGRRPNLRADLVDFLAQYSEEDQARLLEALASLPRSPS